MKCQRKNPSIMTLSKYSEACRKNRKEELKKYTSCIQDLQEYSALTIPETVNMKSLHFIALFSMQSIKFTLDTKI